MEFIIEKDTAKCGEYWNKFSEARVWWDLWEVRECFVRASNYPLHFIVGIENQQPVGVLPLWFNEERGCHSVIGDDFPEGNKFLLKDKSNIKLFLEQCPPETSIPYIDQSETAFYDFPESPDPKYFLDSKNYKGMDDYLATFSPKHRKNLKYDLRHLEDDGYQVKINDFREDLIEIIAELNLKRFQDESSYTEKGFKDSMRNLFELAKSKNLIQVISVVKDNKICGAEFAVLYNNTYTVLTGCSDPDIRNLGKLLIYKHIENSMALGADKLDFMAGADTWKTLWNFDTEKTYEYEK